MIRHAAGAARRVRRACPCSRGSSSRASPLYCSAATTTARRATTRGDCCYSLDAIGYRSASSQSESPRSPWSSRQRGRRPNLPPRDGVALRSSSTTTTSSAAWAKKLRSLLGSLTGKDSEQGEQQQEGEGKPTRSPSQKPKVIDADPSTGSSGGGGGGGGGTSSTKGVRDDDRNRPPRWLGHWSEEFNDSGENNIIGRRRDDRHKKLASTYRIVQIAANRVLEPSAVALLVTSASVVLGLGALEGAVLCSSVPFVECTESGAFVARYALEQLLPSCVWSTQDATLVATAMGYDPNALLRSFDVTDPNDASTLLNVKLLETSRSMAAGFMLLAQLVRIGTIGAAAPGQYMDKVKAGREPPILGFGRGHGQQPGLIIRLCGRESDVTSTSLRRMGRRLFPVFEEPVSRIWPVISVHSEGKRVPVFWSVRPDRYGAWYSWRNFPVSAECLVRTSTGRNLLVLEADATNANDPLALGDEALDLTIDDASQGFRRIQDLFKSASSSSSSSLTSGSGWGRGRSRRGSTATVPPFRTLRVFLGNSLEISKSGGGHAYTLRHRVRYAKEVDVLIDSRAPVLGEILRWCDRVTAASSSSSSSASGGKKNGGDGGRKRRRIILFQTSSRQYFLSLQLLMEKYGYEIHDPLDWRVADGLGGGAEQSEEDAISEDDDSDAAAKEEEEEEDGVDDSAAAATVIGDGYRSMLQVLMDERSDKPDAPGRNEDGDDGKKARRDTLRQITRLSSLPRLVYYGRTAETVNAVQALVNAGEVDAANCCALLDKQEGTHFLKEVLDEKSDLVRRGKMEWRRGKDCAPGDSSGDSPSSSAASNAPDGASRSHPTSGLHIICSSTIYDDLFRQVRQWTRMGYSAKDIQRELDGRYQDMLRQSLEVHETVTEVTKDEEGEEKVRRDEATPAAPVAEEELPEDAQAPPPEDTDTETDKNP